MNERDRALLATISRVTRGGSDITLGLIHVNPNDTQLAQGFRNLGQRYATLAAELFKRAEELDGNPADHMVIHSGPPEIWVADDTDAPPDERTER